MRAGPECFDDFLDHGEVENLIPAEIVPLAERKRNEAGATGLENAPEFPHRRHETVLVRFRIIGISRIEHRIVQADMLDRRNAGDGVKRWSANIVSLRSPNT